MLGPRATSCVAALLDSDPVTPQSSSHLSLHADLQQVGWPQARLALAVSTQMASQSHLDGGKGVALYPTLNTALPCLSFFHCHE